MARSKIKKALLAADSKVQKWTFEIVSNEPTKFFAKVKNQEGKVVFTIKEDEDFNQLSRLLNTSKYMETMHDMKGLAKYCVERGLVTMSSDQYDQWKKNKVLPITIKEIIL